jgi:hypothetical protein
MEAMMEIRRWRALLGAALVLALTAVPAIAAEQLESVEPTSSSATPQPLAGENRIEVEGSSQATVVLTEQQEMMPFDEHIEIATDGRLGALALVERGRVDRAVLLYVEADQDGICGGPCPKSPGAGKQGFVMNGWAMLRCRPACTTSTWSPPTERQA